MYDLAARRTQLTYPGTGLFVNYDYLVTGETSAVRENGASSGVGVLAAFAYDDLGNRTSVTYGNGVVQAYGHDPVSRLSSLSNDLSGTANDLSATFSYNPANQITQTVRTGDAYAFTELGTGTTATTANGLNQQVSIGGGTATWDAKGNLTTDPTSGKTYGYSSENLLTSGSGGVTLGYDQLKRLAQVASGSTITNFAYDGANAIAEYNSLGALQRRYVFADGQPIVQYEGTGTSSRYFMSADERGSIVSVTDSAGALVVLDRYDEYGKPQSTNIGRFQYTGQMWLSELGAYNYKARVYLPHLGIFAQTDPAGCDPSPNLYAYVGGDPLNYGDPSGLGPCDFTSMPSADAVATCSAEAAANAMSASEGTYAASSLMQSLANGMLDQSVASNTMWEAQPLIAEIEAFHAQEQAASSVPTVEIPNILYQEYQEGFLSGNFVGSALKTDPYHSIAQNPIVLQNAVATGTMFYIDSNDYLLPSVLLQANFGYLGQTGVVEYVMPQDIGFFLGFPSITHAVFVPGGNVSGYINDFGGQHPAVPPQIPPVI